MFNATARPLYPRENDAVPFVQEAGWAPGPFWTGVENLTSTVIRSLAVVFVYFVYFLVFANSFISGTGGFIVHNRIFNYVHNYDSILSVLEVELKILCALYTRIRTPSYERV